MVEKHAGYAPVARSDASFDIKKDEEITASDNRLVRALQLE